MNKTKKRIIARHIEICDQIQERYPAFVMPRVVWGRDAKYMGAAWHSGRRVWYNIAALIANISLIDTVVAHELAHCVVSQVMADKGTHHGYRWRRVMMELGYAPHVEITKYNKWSKAG